MFCKQNRIRGTGLGLFPKVPEALGGNIKFKTMRMEKVLCLPFSLPPKGKY